MRVDMIDKAIIINEDTDLDAVFDFPLFNRERSNSNKENREYLPPPKPFVKWAGGKRSLLNEILKHFPDKFNNYFEPFVGGGSVFFAIYDSLNKAILSDLNLDLITTYRVIQGFPKQLIERLEHHVAHHSKDYYYTVRSQHHLNDPIEMAARLLYLNRTCYNGLYRVNKSGKFNTPIGSYVNPNIVREKNILACHQALQGVKIHKQEFDAIKPKKGDVVYFDPPYHPTDELSFTAYHKTNFMEQDQWRLRDFAIKLHKKGVYVILSNSKTRFIEEAYNNKIFHLHIVQAPRYVNCKPNQRGMINELLITNF